MFINGFVIVHNSKYYDYFGMKLELNNGSKIYNGLGRQWGLVEVEDLNINKKIVKAKELYHQSILCNIFRGFKDAEEVKNYLNSNSNMPEQFELIALSSDNLTESIGGYNFDEFGLEFIGVDVESYSAGFIIKEELFAKNLSSRLSDDFKPHVENLNKHGLFNKKETALSFADTYLKIQNKNKLEPLLKGDQELFEIMKPLL